MSSKGLGDWRAIVCKAPCWIGDAPSQSPSCELREGAPLQLHGGVAEMQHFSTTPGATQCRLYTTARMFVKRLFSAAKAGPC